MPRIRLKYTSGDEKKICVVEVRPSDEGVLQRGVLLTLETNKSKALEYWYTLVY